jgi:hypothetical protein
VVGVLGPLERTVHRFVRSAGQTVRLSELGDGKNSDIDTGTQGVRVPRGALFPILRALLVFRRRTLNPKP